MKKKGRVLVVDDEEIVCQSVKKILKKKKLDVDAALSAQEALAKMSETNYDAVLTDLMMPEVTGMQLLETIKAKDPSISVIMITGYPTIRTAVQAIKLGAFDYIPKPFTPEELASVTLRALERTRLYVEEREERVPEPALEEKKPPEIKPEEKAAVIEKVEEEKLYCIPEHSWARVERDGNVRVGMEDMFRRTAGKIVNIDLPFEGDELRQGGVCAHITAGDMHIHKLWSPVSGKVIEVNESVNKNYSLIHEEPRGKGWLIKMEPTSLEEDLENLVALEP
jgi:CheY-like chemotaxis protein/glycine cleavage system H lipoate-binding protein